MIINSDCVRWFPTIASDSLFLVLESQQRGRLWTRFDNTSAVVIKVNVLILICRLNVMCRRIFMKTNPVSLRNWKIHIFLLRGDIWAAWCNVFPPCRALLPAKERRDRLGWTGSVGRTELKTLDLSVWFKVMFRHSSAFLSMTKFHGIFVPWVVKHAAPFTQQI